MWTLSGGLFFVYTTLSLRLHARLDTTAFDLSIFEQVVRSYASGHLPIAEINGPDFPALGDHFSPILAVLAPLYWLWRSPAVLLIAQAALIAASSLPLMLWARRSLGSGPAVAIGFCYGTSWGIASAIGFDFHEVAFAVPLIASSAAALGNGRLRAAAIWALPLVLVKEDLGLTVAVIGILIAWRGDRRLGFSVSVIGFGSSLVEMLVVLPLLSTAGGFGRLKWLQEEGGGGPGGVGNLIHHFTIGVITPEVKVTSLVLVLAPVLFLCLRSPLMLIALPTFLWRFASSYPGHWGTSYHYSLILMPIVFSAFIDCLARRNSNKNSIRRYVAGCVGFTLLLIPQFPLWQLFQPAMWKTDPRVLVAHRLMDQIPDGATVQATNKLVPQIAGRTGASVFGWTSRPHPQWILVDTQQSERWPLSVDQEQNLLTTARLTGGYRTVAEENGFVLLKLRGPSSRSK
ncbi:DUF2079 domain-containing protein [Streptomyces sp. NBC_01142]|uniref:DUF2079 domain-containing protein n=1 Tax=Streptomyces sp. NBC_01142 TaxID=2975865 RepID=UPI002256A4F1|nr:DUF2079 domain-containing protein [Streptomyces sp. NBC_01142]MCX4821545.1 DUF2079 domain-containing protein [Streptomyces sp. NBC_01142]